MLRSIEEGRRKTPPREPRDHQLAILNARPDLDTPTMDAVQLVVEAYHDLDTCRPIGMVAGRIPWTAARDWARDRRELDEEARRILVRAIRYVDDLEFAERNKPRAPAPPPRPAAPAAARARRQQEAR